MEDKFWLVKLFAFLHDPAEKAITLLRDIESHEEGTVKKLREEIGIQDSLDSQMGSIKLADILASSADRLSIAYIERKGQFRVNFVKDPELVNPISGTRYEMKRMGMAEELGVNNIKDISFDHFNKLIAKDDFKKTFLSFWRDGPASPSKNLGALWGLLPADTRCPDHSIWEHLSLTSAFAGTLLDEKGPALLSFSFGPIQAFIEQARSTSDLWAGSHLLSRIAWEGLKVVCDELGPDSIISPDLFEIPIVDTWLEGVGISIGDRSIWKKKRSDGNPLFSASLTNRFVALVPFSRAKDIADDVASAMRGWLKEITRKAAERFLEATGNGDKMNETIRQQIEEQLEGFPEVYWSCVPWFRDGKKEGTPNLEEEVSGRLGIFYPKDEPPESVNELYKKIPEKEIDISINGETLSFYAPNYGVLYPFVYEQAERLLAATKSLRDFGNLTQDGYRCSLCGEREWLTLDRADLQSHSGKTDLWSRIDRMRYPWIREGERLCAICNLKRWWPVLFTDEVKGYLGGEDIRRYIVSTHTMALSKNLEKIVDKEVVSEEKFECITKVVEECLEKLTEEEETRKVALPYRIVKKGGEKRLQLAKKIPAIYDILHEKEEKEELRERDDLLKKLNNVIKETTGSFPERYYALLIMDGDRMGAWISGENPLKYGDVLHSNIKNELQSKKNEALNELLESELPPSPARHGAISRALNRFSIQVARFVVEELCKGKLIYSGGDDVMAMSSIDDLMDMMLLLRCAYSGVKPPDSLAQRRKLEGEIKICNDYILLGTSGGERCLIRTMGHKATASMGVVIAHHMAPLQVVLREAREAEKRAKNEGGRNAFSISLIKRAGGITHFTSKWGIDDKSGKGDDREGALEGKFPTAVPDVIERMALLLIEDVSRRAAYHILGWLKATPEEALADSMKYHLYRHRREKKEGEEVRGRINDIVNDLRSLAEDVARGGGVRGYLEGIITMAEFLSREMRTEK